MAREVVDIAIIELDGREVQSIVSLDITQSNPNAEAVPTMRRKRRAIGYKRGVPEFRVRIEAKELVPPEIDWYGLERTGKLFLIAYEENEDGNRFHLQDCLVIEVNKSHNANGESVINAELLALDHKPEA